jgi:hypothetical protein
VVPPLMKCTLSVSRKRRSALKFGYVNRRAVTGGLEQKTILVDCDFGTNDFIVLPRSPVGVFWDSIWRQLLSNYD